MLVFLNMFQRTLDSSEILPNKNSITSAVSIWVNAAGVGWVGGGGGNQ